MSTVQEFADKFPNERVLQQALAKLLSRVPNHTGVQILQGNNEVGKDIIFYTQAAFGQKELNACVVKNTKITGNASNTTGARTVFNQAQQALDTPLLDENGHEQRVKRVFIITPHPIPPETVLSIVGALRASSDQVQFMSGTTLLELFKLHWPEYLAEEFKLIQTYADTLTQTTAAAKELEGLSFQYQLGTVNTSIKRVYVQPHFHRFVRSYSLLPLRGGVPKNFSEFPYSQDSVEDFKTRIKSASDFIGTVAEWGLCDERIRRKARAACNQFLGALTTSWSQALTGRAARAGSTVQAGSFSAKLTDVSQLNHHLETARMAIDEALRDLSVSLGLVREYVKSDHSGTPDTFIVQHDSTINKLDEIARISGGRCMAQDNECSIDFTSKMIVEYPGSLFIVAPAGFGKTSFCRWHALNDLERLLQGDSRTLPVYVPLHQIEVVEGRDFESLFLQHAGVSALLPKDSRTQYERTRVYLDGLDEVASEEKQECIAKAAQAATKKDPTLQVIVTARDYVYGPWMTWLPRVHLSGFDDGQVRELVTNWLDDDNEKITTFFEQLERSRSLKEMMAIPLLATLTVLVFKQTGKLPENKTRLYEIFVDLHNGGWDLVKSIQRPSRFSAAEKMFVLKRIAATIHEAKRREALETEAAAVAKAALRQVEWAVLRDELVRDGLILQLGSMVSFAHHSFQEFLAARHLFGDVNNARLDACCEEYMRGSDWWQEVLCFYIDFVGKPQETLAWLEERKKEVSKYPGRGTDAAKRESFLRRHLESSFPFAKVQE